MHHLTDRILYTTICYTSCGAPAGMRNSSMGPPIAPSTSRSSLFIINDYLSYGNLSKLKILVFIAVAISSGPMDKEQ